MNIIFQTPRLSVQRVDIIHDKPQLLTYHNDSLTMQWIPNTDKKWREDELIKKFSINTSLYSQNLGIYKIALHHIKQIIGEVGLFPYEQNENYIEIGYIIHRNFWNYGLGTELVSSLIEYITANFNYTGIIAQLYAENTASKRLCEKLHFHGIAEEILPDNRKKLVYLKCTPNNLNIIL